MNRVEARLEFYFKGQCFTPAAVVNLDDCMRHEDPMTHILSIVAAENGIGSHSHEFDVMMEEEISFDYPTGLVTAFIYDNKLDLDGFRIAWLEQSTMRVLQPIASLHLGITDLDKHPQLKAALIAVYQAK